MARPAIYPPYNKPNRKRLLNLGLWVYEIAEITGRKETTVRKWLSEHHPRDIPDVVIDVLESWVQVDSLEEKLDYLMRAGDV